MFIFVTNAKRCLIKPRLFAWDLELILSRLSNHYISGILVTEVILAKC